MLMTFVVQHRSKIQNSSLEQKPSTSVCIPFTVTTIFIIIHGSLPVLCKTDNICNKLVKLLDVEKIRYKHSYNAVKRH